MDEQPKTKKCSICGEEKNVSEFYKAFKSPDGIQSSCKICAPRKGNNYSPRTKICSRCKKRKNKSEYSKNSTRPDGLQTYCKKCADDYNKSDEVKKSRKLNLKKQTLSKNYVLAVEEAQKFIKENPTTAEEVTPSLRRRGVTPQPPRSPDRTKIRNRKEPRKNSLTKKDFYYKGYFLNLYNALKALGLGDTTIAIMSGEGENKIAFKSRISRDSDIDIAYQEAMAELELRLSHLMLVMAKGYDFDEVKIKSLKSPITGAWIEIEKTITTKHHAGDMQALIMYLTNRFPDKWKVSRELLTGRTQTYDETPSKRDRKAIESYARDVLEENPDKPETECSVSAGASRVSGGSEQTGKK